MGLVFMIVAGAILGWIATFVQQAASFRGLRANLGAGIAGALLAGLLIGPRVGAGNLLSGQYSVDALLVTALGSLLLLASVNLLRKQELL